MKAVYRYPRELLVTYINMRVELPLIYACAVLKPKYLVSHPPIEMTLCFNTCARKAPASDDIHEAMNREVTLFYADERRCWI